MPFKVLTAEMSHETNSFSLQETDEAGLQKPLYSDGCRSGSPSVDKRIRNSPASLRPVERKAGMSIMCSVQPRGQAEK